MPELPEVEVVRLFLEDRLVGKKITKLNIITPKSFSGNPGRVIDQTVRSFSRIGKQLSIYLSNGLVLLVHLKMTGQLIYIDKKSATTLGHPTPNLSVPNNSTRLVFNFTDRSSLFFNDQRKFGWIKVLSPDELVESQKNLGVDIFSPKFTPKYIYSQLHSSSRPVKLVLLDQTHFAGIGNIYANDALFLSRIHPQTPSRLISLNQSQKIHHSLINIMKASVLHGGSTAKDNKYLLPDQSFGSHQFHFQVYQRQGEPCLVCHTLITKFKLGGRGTFYCPHCQKKSF